MGGDLLRRKILNSNKKSEIVPKVFLCIAVLGCLSTGMALQAQSAPPADTQEPAVQETVVQDAAENEADLPAAIEQYSSAETPLYSRPLRTRQDADPLNPLVPTEPPVPTETAVSTETAAASQTGGGKYPPSVLLDPEALSSPLTQQYIQQYSSPGGRSWLSTVMERGGPYLAFIRREIAARKLPPELLYIPVIESAYLTTAMSKSGAAGLWQFMRNSIGPFNIKVNDWVDERLDFWKSTDAALRKLKENYDRFGNWPLALAAYNAGLGAVNRALQQGGGDYWVLSQKKLLKTETIHYVPKLLAVAYIASNPRRFGMTPFWPEDPQWQQVAVERSADLRLLADKAGMDSRELISANRELLYNVTPPEQSYFLKVSKENAEKVASVLAQKDISLIRYYIHTIHSGDTLLALALHYGITVEQILASNPGVQERYLKLGSRLLIPALKEADPYVQPVSSGENLSFNGTHLVKKGETLWSIALAYEVDPEVLAEANGIGLTSILREGQILKTPIK